MTREHKLALILGFSLVLVVGVLISDHLSGASRAELDAVDTSLASAEGGPRATPRPVVIDRGLEPGAPQPLTLTGTPVIPSPRERELGAPSVLEDVASGARQVLGDTLESLRRGDLPVAAETDPRIEASPAEVPGVLVQDPEQHRQRLEDRLEGRIPRHRVERNETLWGIAARYYDDGALHARLAAYNREHGEGWDDVLAPGDVVLVPPKGILLGDPVRAEAPRTTPPRRRTYRVQEGDTLSEISARELDAARRWREILDLNAALLDGPEDLRPGMVLELPAD